VCHTEDKQNRKGQLKVCATFPKEKEKLTRDEEQEGTEEKRRKKKNPSINRILNIF